MNTFIQSEGLGIEWRHAMKNKRKRRIRTYMVILLCACLCILFVLDNFEDFFLGFFAGIHSVDADFARKNYGELSQIAGWITIAIVIAAGVLGYIQIKKKIAQPIEQLADGMHEVSQGNLDVRVPVNGDFEFEQMQESFNYMVGELDRAKQNRELVKKRNQQLYAGIAHDLKTPMTMILGYAKLLEKESGIKTEDRQRYLETIIEQTEHANVLLDSLLAYAKLENEDYQLKREEQDIAECLRACVADYYPVLEEAQIQLELQIPDKPVMFSFDLVEMKRVFINLLSNMAKHNPKHTSGSILLEEKGGIFRIVVADDGPKIAEDLQEMLFDLFAVGDCSRNTKNGSGLGLSISKKIIERHDGKMYYANDIKDGYKGFVIELYGKSGFSQD